MRANNDSSGAAGVLQELEDIKRPLVLALLRSGASQADVARALGVNQSSVSRMFPGGVSKAAKLRQEK